MIRSKIYFILLFSCISNKVVGNVYYIAPSYPATIIPRGYQPPPFGILVDENNYQKNQNQLSFQQEYTLMRFNSKEPSPKVLRHQFQGQHKSNQNYQKQSFQQSTTQQVQFQQKPQLQKNKNTQFQMSVDKYNKINPQEQNKISDLQKNLLNHERHHHHPPEPTLINTLIQVFASDALERKISLTETRSMSAVEDPEIFETATNNSHHVILSKKLDTKTYTFLPQNEIIKTNDKNRFVAVKAFAATNSSKISENELKSELSRELQASIPLIIEELERLQQQKTESIILSTTSAPFYTTSKAINTDTHNIEKLIKSDLKTKDLVNLIEEGLDEIDESTVEKNDSLTTPLIVFTKTTAISQQQQQQSSTTSNNFQKSIILTATVSNYFKNETTQNNKDKISFKIDHLTTITPITKFFTKSKFNKFLPEEASKEDDKTIEDTDTNWITFANNENDTEFLLTISPTTNDFTSVSLNKNISKNSKLLNSSEISFLEALKKFNNENNAFTDIDKKSTTISSHNLNSSLSQSFNSTFETLIESTTNINIENSLSTSTNVDISEMPIIIGTSSENQESCKQNNNNNKIKGDILFLIDSSDSVGSEKFKYSVKLIYDTVKNLEKNFGSNGIQISLIQYNQEPILEFSFRGHKCLENVLTDILSIKYMMGVSNLNRAIKKAMKCGFTKSRGDRSDVDNILVLITSGLNKDKLELPTELSESNDTTVLVVATADRKLTDLSTLINNNQQNIFNLTKKELNTSLAQSLADRIQEVLTDKNQNILLIKEKVSTQSFELSTKNAFPQSDQDFFQYTTAQSFTNNFNIKENNINLKFNNQLENAVPLINSLDDFDVVVEVNCLAKGIDAKFALPAHFKGSIVANGFETDSNCVTKVESINNNVENSIQYKAVEIHHPHCGLNFVKSEFPRGINESIVLSVIHNKQLKTNLDRSFVINCFIPLFAESEATNSNNTSVNSQLLEANLNVIPTMALSKTISVIGAPPKCYYSLRRDSPNGPVLKEAQIGQIIYHRWECNNENIKIKDEIMAFGLHVYNCYANSRLIENNKNLTIKYSNNSYQYVNEAGCSTDDSLLNEIIYDEDHLLAYAKAYVFTLHNVEALKFSCKIGLCVRDNDGCEGYSPPICQSTSNMSDSLLLTRHQLRQKDLSIEAALSSFVEAPRLAVLASKTFNSDNLNQQAHLSRFVTFGNGIRVFSINSKNSLSLTFIICFLLGALIVGSMLGLFCFYILRCLNRWSLDDDDEASLVISSKHLNNSNFNFYKYNDNLSDKLSFTSFTSPITKNNQILATYKGTLKRCAKSDELITDNNIMDVSKSTSNTNTNDIIPEKNALIPNMNFNSEIIKSNVNSFNSSLILPSKSMRTPINVEKNCLRQENNLVSTMHVSRLPTITSPKYTSVKSPSIERRCLGNKDTLLLRSPPSPSRIPRKLPEKLLLNLNN